MVRQPGGMRHLTPLRMDRTGADEDGGKSNQRSRASNGQGDPPGEQWVSETVYAFIIQ